MSRVRPLKRPDRLYKFLNQRYADGMLLRGIIRIGTAEEYRVPDGRDGERSDDTELKRKWQPGDAIVITEVVPLSETAG
jgi:hypothetical protein